MIRVAATRDSDPIANKFESFDPDNYQDGDTIRYYDNGWHVGRISRPNNDPLDIPQIINNRLFITVTDLNPEIIPNPDPNYLPPLGVPTQMYLNELPEKVDISAITDGEKIRLNENWYSIKKSPKYGDKGELLVDAEPVVPGKGEPMHDVSIEVINSAKKIDARKQFFIDDMHFLAERAREDASEQSTVLVGRLSELRNKIAGMPSKLGKMEEWDKMSQQKAKEISNSVEALFTEVQEALNELELEMTEIEQLAITLEENQKKVLVAEKINNIYKQKLDIADNQEELDDAGQPLVAEAQRVKNKEPYKKWEQYQVDLAKWEKAKAKFESDPARASDKKEFKPTAPKVVDCPPLPSDSKEVRALAKEATVIDVMGGNDPQINALRPGLVQETIRRRRAHFAENVISDEDDYPDGPEKDRISAIKLFEILNGMNGWKDLETAPSTEAFNFDKEKNWLQDKHDELLKKVDTISDRSVIMLQKAYLEEINNDINNPLWDQNTPHIEIFILDQRNKIGKVDLEIEAQLHGENAIDQTTATGESELREDEVTISGPDLIEIMKERAPQMRELMLMLYEIQLGMAGEDQAEELSKLDEAGKKKLIDELDQEQNNNVIEKLKELFENPSTNPAVLNKLRQNGVRDWAHLQKLVEANSKNMIDTLHRMAQEDLRGQVSSNSSVLGKTWAQARFLGARVATTMALVGGGTFAAKVASGPMGWLGIAAIGAGAGVGRSLLQIHYFGTDEQKAKQQAALQKYGQKIRKEVIKKLEKLFVDSEKSPKAGTKKDKARISKIEEYERIFSSLLSFSLKESMKKDKDKGESTISIEDLTEEEKQELKSAHEKLDEPAKDLYVAVIKQMRLEYGHEPEFAQKLDLMLGLATMREKFKETQAEVDESKIPFLKKWKRRLSSADWRKKEAEEYITGLYSGTLATKERGYWVGTLATMTGGATVANMFAGNAPMLEYTGKAMESTGGIVSDTLARLDPGFELAKTGDLSSYAGDVTFDVDGLGTLIDSTGAAVASTSFLLVALGGVKAGLHSGDRRATEKSEIKAKELLVERLKGMDAILESVETAQSDPNTVVNPDDLDNLTKEYASFKVLLGGKDLGDVKNEDLIEYLKNFEMAKAQVRDRFDKAQNLLLKNSLDGITKINDEVEKQAKKETTWGARQRKKSWQSLKRIVWATGSAAVYGTVGILFSSLVYEAATETWEHVGDDATRIAGNIKDMAIPPAQAAEAESPYTMTSQGIAIRMGDPREFGASAGNLEHGAGSNKTFFDNVGAETNGNKVAFELGEKGAPSTRSELYRLIALNTMKGSIGADSNVDPIEQFKVANVGANLKALASGNSVGGVESSEFAKYVNTDGNKITVTDWKGFQDNVLNPLENSAKAQAMLAVQAGKTNIFTDNNLVNWNEDLKRVGGLDLDEASKASQLVLAQRGTKAWNSMSSKSSSSGVQTMRGSGGGNVNFEKLDAEKANAEAWQNYEIDAQKGFRSWLGKTNDARVLAAKDLLSDDGRFGRYVDDWMQKYEGSLNLPKAKADFIANVHNAAMQPPETSAEWAKSMEAEGSNKADEIIKQSELSDQSPEPEQNLPQTNAEGELQLDANDKIAVGKPDKNGTEIKFRFKGSGELSTVIDNKFGASETKMSDHLAKGNNLRLAKEVPGVSGPFFGHLEIDSSGNQVIVGSNPDSNLANPEDITFLLKNGQLVPPAESNATVN